MGVEKVTQAQADAMLKDVEEMPEADTDEAAKAAKLQSEQVLEDGAIVIDKDNMASAIEQLAAYFGEEEAHPDGEIIPGEDNNPGCARWAAAGECATNPAYMLTTCARSCKETVPESPTADADTPTPTPTPELFDEL